jgi:hypothetical protein
MAPKMRASQVPVRLFDMFKLYDTKNSVSNLRRKTGWATDEQDEHGFKPLRHSGRATALAVELRFG